MKKLISLALVLMLAAAMFAGCGNTTPAPTPAQPAESPVAAEPTPAPAPEAPAAPAETVNIRWMYTGNDVKDDSKVMEAVNKILGEKINAKLEMIWCTWGDFGDRAVLAINGGDNVDIYYSSYADKNEYVRYAQMGAYARLDDPANDLLAQYAPNYFNGMADGIRTAMVTDGANGRGVYAVPALKETAVQYAWEFNMDMFAKHNLSPDSFTNLYDMGDLLKTVKAAEGADFYPLTSDFTVLERMNIPTENIDSIPVLAAVMDPVNPSKSATEIVSRYETEAFKKYVTQMREYFNAGYVNPAAAVRDTMAQAWSDQKSAGKFLISSRIAAPNYEIGESAAFGYTEKWRNAIAGVNNTNGPRGAIHAVSTVSKNPGVALQVLDIVNSDTVVHNLLARGVEGVHYNLENGKIRFTDEKQNYTVWAAGLGRLSDLIPTVDDPDPADWKASIEKFNDVETSPLMGWLFNPTPVETEMSTLANVVEEYYPALICGSVDPEKMLPEFIEKLKANGLEKVVAEANTQLKAFLAA